MKKLIPILMALVLLTACRGEEAASSDTASAAASTSTIAESTLENVPDSIAASELPSASPAATATAEVKATTAPKVSVAPTAAPTTAPAPAPTEAHTPEPTAAPTPAPTQDPAAPVLQPTMTGGSLPLEVAANSDQWWAIDSSDSAYWAVADSINAIRAASGLGALSVDGGLSSVASSRCENFVAGGAFDHSGMTTKSEICAAGGITSASAVCTAWEGSADHYANIMRTDISSMGIGCWFCYSGGGYYAYWVVTFQ